MDDNGESRGLAAASAADGPNSHELHALGAIDLSSVAGQGAGRGGN